eukprot:2356057-Rhodomonas_salina.1
MEAGTHSLVDRYTYLTTAFPSAEQGGVEEGGRKRRKRREGGREEEEGGRERRPLTCRLATAPRHPGRHLVAAYAKSARHLPITQREINS